MRTFSGAVATSILHAIGRTCSLSAGCKWLQLRCTCDLEVRARALAAWPSSSRARVRMETRVHPCGVAETATTERQRAVQGQLVA